jgi:di/tricarboxylate transporter
MEAWIVLILLAITVGLFATEKISVDVVTLLLLCTLILTGILTVDEAFIGFSSGIVVMLAAIFVIGTALRDSGVLDAVAQGMARVLGSDPTRLTAVMMSGVGLLSAFMNNTTVTAMFVGPIVRLSRQVGISSSRLLMPLAFASILGGTCTLIGTSTNVAVSGYLKKHGLPELGMFEFTGIGVTLMVVGVVYMLVFGRYLLPERLEDSETLAPREYLAEVVILAGSPLIGQGVLNSDFSVLGFTVVKILRDRQEVGAVSGEHFAEGDLVLVAGKVVNLIKIKKIEGLDISEDVELRRGGVKMKDAHIAEVVITPRSRLVGRTLRESQFRQTAGLSVLALMRGDQSLLGAIADTPLKAGDLMLVQGPLDFIRRYEEDAELVVISDHPGVASGMTRGMAVLGLFIAAIAAGSMELLPVPVALLLVALFAVLTRAVSVETAYENIDWRLLILISGMMAFGEAMTSSGAADMVAGAVVSLLLPLGSLAVLAGFALLAMLLTQQMSNAAAALVVLPVALRAAETLGLESRPFAITVMLSASVAVLTPFEPSCLLIYGPGKYRFSDFFKVGSGLALITLVIILVMVPWYWPLKAQ